ncbi:DUF5753 domain-containing protein [Nocardia fluminea]|uniref:DUF5753 domain-containing protein n=1 Tax=Nocardia fluminea TaxID=134984 RepID=A0A2N3V505_9NOCA|nr:DUF5753 domain-containing protein [Nocardia fluminea]PKV76708.1 hypothetical protein ATK86_7109 [Nocardia fluminea]
MATTSWYDVTDGGLETLQRSLIPLESDTKNQRSYNPMIIPGLLQTHDYAQAILTKCSAVLEFPDDSEATAIARMERQNVLDQPGHEFHMLIGEAALRLTVGSSEVMAAQIRQLADVLTAREHVRIGIIPLNAEFVAPAINFVLNDTTSADSEAITGPIENTESAEIELVERTFNLLATTAVYGEEAHAILTRALASHTESGI